MLINSHRLRTLRKQKKLSRQQLADKSQQPDDKSRISPRTIARLESNAASSNSTRERTINKLADALRVEPGVLTGELPMPEAARLEDGERVQVSALLAPEVRLAYDLIKRRYGVNPTMIFNLGPLLFTLLAEGSLAWRRQKVNEVGEIAERLYDMGGIAGHLSFAFAAYRVQEGARGEDESISKRDLFGEQVSEDAFELGYDRSTNNPFADYLRQFARKLGDPSVILLDPDFDDVNPDGPMKGFPEYIVCQGDIEKITGGSAQARWALKLGGVRLKDIPDELWMESATDRRVQWLEEKSPLKDLTLDLSDFDELLEADGEEVDQ